MADVIIYTTAWCPYCIKAKRLLDSKKVEYTEIDVSEPAVREQMASETKGRTVPQIVIDAQVVGGCDDLYVLEHNGQLDKLLQK
jgi:glutaredoxin 3